MAVYDNENSGKLEDGENPKAKSDQQGDVGASSQTDAVKKSEDSYAEGASSGTNSSASSSREDIQNAEQNAGTAKTGTNQDESSKSTTESTEGSAFNYHAEGGRRSKLLFGAGKGKGTFRSKFSKRLLLGVGAVGGVGFIGIALVAIFLLGSLLIPNLAQNITVYQFARVTQQFSQNAQRATEEKLAVDAADDSVATDIENESSTGVKALLDKFNSYRPSTVIDNLKTNNGFKTSYKTTALGREQLTGITIDDSTYLPVEQGLTRFVPGLGSIIKFKNDITLSKNVAPALDTAIRSNDTGMIVRNVTEDQLRQEWGIGLVAWNIGKYQGKTAEQAEEQQVKDLASDVDSTSLPDNAVTDTIKNADSAAKNAEDEVLSNPTELEQTINNGGIAQAIQTAVTNSLASSGLQTAVSIINPIYKVAMPICIVYDGSLNSASTTIDNQTRQQAAAYYYLASAADQQKSGDTTAEAVGALNNDLDSSDNIAQSNPEVRASGGTIDTSTTASAEASAAGQFTLLNVILPSAVAGTINAIATPVCSTLTNIWAGIGLGLGNIVVTILSGGTEGAAADVASTDASEVISQEASENVTGNLFSRLVSNTGAITSRVGKLVGGTGDFAAGALKTAAKIVPATLFAKYIVMSRAGQINSGLAQGNDLANEADSGGNIVANSASQSINFGRPLTQTETVQSNQSAQQYVADQTSQESAYQRYFALTNANSLLSRIGMDLYGAIYSRSIFSSFLTAIGRAFDPLTLFSSIFGSHNALAADPTDANSEYGNVQFGWSQDEENLIDSSSTYLPIENQQILDASGKEDQIAQEYAPCFGYTADANGNLTLADNEQIGDLLSSGDIVRDSNGDVLDSGLCSPSNLSYDNTSDPLAADNVTVPDPGTGEDIKSPETHDMVFRWRLAMAYNNVLDEYDQISSPAQ